MRLLVSQHDDLIQRINGRLSFPPRRATFKSTLCARFRRVSSKHPPVRSASITYLLSATLCDGDGNGV